MGGDNSEVDIAINVQDLTNGSHLKDLLQDNAKPLFQFATGIAPLWNQPIAKVPQGTCVDFSISDSASWATGTGVCFALTPSSSCKLEVIAQGALLKYAPDLDSAATAELPGVPYGGSAYLKLSLDFSITGKVSGAGTAGGFGISGSAKATGEASFIFCHRVPNTTQLSDAVRETFNGLVFPSHPSCAADMLTNDMSQISFKGTLGCSLTVSYGIAHVDFAAPSVGSVLDSVKQGAVQLHLPSGSIDVGASANISYTHSDEFTAVVQKSAAAQAFLYVMRARRDDAAESLGVNAKITIDDCNFIAPDPKNVARAVDSVCGFGGDQVADVATGLSGKLNDALNDKLNDWRSNIVGDGVSLTAAWEQQRSTCMLYLYRIPLDTPALVTRSWTSLCYGDVKTAVESGGLIPDAGSGISRKVSRSFTISLQLFNFFAAKNTTEYFSNSKTFITDTGNIRYVYDVGEESDTTINKVVTKCRIHFIASVDELSAKSISNASVNLQLELSENGNSNEAGRMAGIVGYIPGPESGAAQQAMQKYVGLAATGTLNLVCVLTPSAYGRLACSDLSQQPVNLYQDSLNWVAYHDATVKLIPNAAYLRPLTFQTWETFNLLCRGKKANDLPDRRDSGNIAIATDTFWQGRGINAPAPLVNDFCVSSASFMNLCDELHSLAGKVAAAGTPDEWQQLLNDLKGIVKKDASNMHYIKPAMAGLLQLCHPQTVKYKPTTGKDSFTCTLTLS
jgi:hypothetical protein